ncbi:MAG: hypothetical protein WBP47_17960, partial [Candidatus Promineifilaceae bacterium]
SRGILTALWKIRGKDTAPTRRKFQKNLPYKATMQNAIPHCDTPKYREDTSLTCFLGIRQIKEGIIP